MIDRARRPAALFLILAGGLLGRQCGERGPVPPAARRQQFEVRFESAPLRTAVHLSYRHRGLGEVRISNLSGLPASKLRLAVEIPGRKDLLPEPFTAELPAMAAGGTATVKVLPHFSPAILDQATTEVLFRAVLLDDDREVVASTTLVPLIERSQMTWDVPERIAALIDPEPLLALVREALAAGTASKMRAGDLPIPNLRAGAGAFDFLMAWGFRYLEDSPAAAAQALLGVPVDRVNGPDATLRDHGGDCDDLSVLLAAALEAAGVPSALGISENHVFVLLDTGIDSLESSAVDPSWVLERGGRAWMPIEATCLARTGSTLLSASGAARTRLPALRSGETKFIDIRKAWSDYPALAAPSIRKEAAGRVPPAGASRAEREAPASRPASEGELARVLLSGAARKAEEARARGEGDAGEGDRRAAAVFFSSGFHFEAAELLRRALGQSPSTETRLELAGAILAAPRDGADLAEARREIQTALGELDPLDLASRSEALKKFEEVSLLLGDSREAKRAAAAAADPLGDAFTAAFPPVNVGEPGKASAAELALGPRPGAGGKGGL